MQLVYRGWGGGDGQKGEALTSSFNYDGWLLGVRPAMKQSYRNTKNDLLLASTQEGKMTAMVLEKDRDEATFNSSHICL